MNIGQARAVLLLGAVALIVSAVATCTADTKTRWMLELDAVGIFLLAVGLAEEGPSP